MNDLVPLRDLEVMAAAFAKSKLFGAKTPEEALSLMLVAQAEGMHPAAAARDYHIIQGKGSKKAEAMHRDFLNAGGKVEWHKLDDTAADATFSHPQGGTVRIVWDMERVAKAKISNKEMYDKYRRQMLRNRCVAEGARTVYPAATGGMYAPEEITDADLNVIDGKTGEIIRPQSKSKRANETIDQDPSTATPPGPQEPPPPFPSPAPAGAASSSNGATLPEGKLKILRARMNGKVTDEMVAKQFGKPLAELPDAKFNDIATWIREQQK